MEPNCPYKRKQFGYLGLNLVEVCSIAKSVCTGHNITGFAPDPRGHPVLGATHVSSLKNYFNGGIFILCGLQCSSIIYFRRLHLWSLLIVQWPTLYKMLGFASRSIYRLYWRGSVSFGSVEFRSPPNIVIWLVQIMMFIFCSHLVRIQCIIDLVSYHIRGRLVY